MKATHENGQRRIRLTNIPTQTEDGRHTDLPATLDIVVTYAIDDPSPVLNKAVCIDSIVIPAIVAALNRRPPRKRADVKAEAEKAEAEIKARLEYLRGEIEAERISFGEIAELVDLKSHIDPDDMLLLEWAGVPEFPEEDN